METGFPPFRGPKVLQRLEGVCGEGVPMVQRWEEAQKAESVVGVERLVSWIVWSLKLFCKPCE